ncbi:MAG: NAD(P)H-hydrate dehydratase [Campylobacteraceae bacterium]|nr:NAD(P)H-hydrate dehydratase [Campylobacteraceae bacterium]
MQKIFHKTDMLDRHAQKKFLLSEEILMENAARSIAEFVKIKAKKGADIIFLCGSGNNGADGFAAARMLAGSFNVSVFCVYLPKSPLAKVQFARLKSLHVKILKTLPKSADIYIDCILGSGQKGAIDKSLKDLLLHVNTQRGLKIACDIPTAIYLQMPFKADFTLTMGALKSTLFEDFAKDYVGEVICCDLGIDRSKFEDETDIFLLEKDDLILPTRESKNSNKGDFGHLLVVSGEKAGASVLSGLTALSFGTGLVSLLVNEKLFEFNPSLMQTEKFPDKTTAVIVGMGLGERKIDPLWFENLPSVIDADLCYDKRVKEWDNPKCVITPHPKEFSSLLEIFGFGKINAEEIQQRRFFWAKEFSFKFNGVLVLKGANTIIAQRGVLYVCQLGSQALAKGGSGDILAGLIGALLAQNRSPLDAAVSGVLAHALASLSFEKNNYALTPEGLIEEIKRL